MLSVAVIGCGQRLASLLPSLLGEGKTVRLAGIYDPDPAMVRRRLDAEKVGHAGVRFYDSVADLLNDGGRFHGVMVGTRCRLHTPTALEIARLNLPMYLEKPVAISREQLHALRDAWRGREKQVVVSFPLRVTPVVLTARAYLNAGRLGPINQIQAYNNPEYSDAYYATWYRRFEEAGGLWLQKATHDFDYVNLLVGARPLRIAAMMTQRVFGTGRVLTPDECNTFMCGDSSNATEDISAGDAALDDRGSRFHAAIRNQDAGSALIWYENGVIASYDQNFVGRRSAGRRGATVTGYNGTVDLSWAPSQAVKFVDHFSDVVEEQDCTGTGSHGGGDNPLTEAFEAVMAGRAGSPVDLRAGLQSVAMCLAAREAARTHTVQPIEDMGMFEPCKPFDFSKVEQASGLSGG